MEAENVNKKRFLEQFKGLAISQEVSAKTVLLHEGDVSKKMYFIEKGCLRLWFNNNGRDVTFQFFFEGDMVSSAESFWMDQPSMFTIESIESTRLMVITKKDFQSVYENSADMKSHLESYLFKRLFSYQRLFLSRIKESPQERYKELIAHSPQILKRVPQHYIASYLGITPVSLSRIRNRE